MNEFHFNNMKIRSTDIGNTVLKCETWVKNELVLSSDKLYSDPFTDVSLDLILTHGRCSCTVPGFWDGQNIFRVRFVCPSPGEWYFRTVCSDAGNADLHGIEGIIDCTAYSGSLEIYRRGFITAGFGKKYFTYADGTPFFYLGDTHWSLGDETADMVREICEKRVSQGFTVWQSEPIGAKFDLTDGIDESDIPGLREYDEKFRIIAEYGFVHANAQFFFPSRMDACIDAHGGYSGNLIYCVVAGKELQMPELSDRAKKYLEKLSRYWIARYSAFPVCWTLGQEVDDDFYWNDTSSRKWNVVNNPYKLVARFLAKYDPYAHPITAHQENAALVGAYGSGEGTGEKRRVYSKTLSSAFRTVFAHDFYAVQWSPSLNRKSDCKIERDFWHNGQGKPIINYEGRYCYLWTKNFGSRMQGWASYLSGMFGYGWGGQDTWSYLNPYDENKDTDDGVDTITAAEKIAADWRSALEYPSSYQAGYMRSFLEQTKWYKLNLRFDNPGYFRPSHKVYAYVASNKENTEIVLYFYSFDDMNVAERPNSTPEGAVGTGTLGRLVPNERYIYRWFDPIAGEYIGDGSFTASPDGTRELGPKPKNTDLALLIRKTPQDTPAAQAHPYVKGGN